MVVLCALSGGFACVGTQFLLSESADSLHPSGFTLCPTPSDSSSRHRAVSCITSPGTVLLPGV